MSHAHDPGDRGPHAPGLVQLRRRGDAQRAAPRRGAFARHIIAVTSGKGGVGKSTVAVNIAAALARRGQRVGILDADVYGPSVPRLLNVEAERLVWNDQDRMVPARNFGIEIVSAGLTTPQDDTPLAWRSSVAISALMQLIDDVAWGALDVLVIDMPPGTGDVQLSVAQELPISAAVLVTTPQTIATDDVRRALRMFLEMRVPIGGVVENMSHFVVPGTGAIVHPFGQGGGRELARRYGVPFLGELPLDPDIRVLCDIGMPAAIKGTAAHRAAFGALVDALQEKALAPAGATPTPERSAADDGP